MPLSENGTIASTWQSAWLDEAAASKRRRLPIQRKNGGAKPVPWTALPEGTLSITCSFLPVGSLLKASGSCKLLRSTANDESIWRGLCISEWASCASLKVPSFLTFYKQRKGKVPARDHEPQAKLEDYTLLVDVTTEEGVHIASKSLPLTNMRGGHLSIGSFTKPWGVLQPLTTGSTVRIEGIIVRKSDAKTLLISKEPADDSDGDGRLTHLFWFGVGLPEQEQWFGTIDFLGFEIGWSARRPPKSPKMHGI